MDTPPPVANWIFNPVGICSNCGAFGIYRKEKWDENTQTLDRTVIFYKCPSCHGIFETHANDSSSTILIGHENSGWA